MFRRATGLWVALTPRPERRAFTSWVSQADAIERRAAYLARRGSIAAVRAEQPFAQFLRAFLKTKDVRERTYDGYSTVIEQHIIPKIGTHRLCDLKPQHIAGMLEGVRSPWRRWEAWRLLKEALSVASDWDIIGKSPALKVKAPKKPSREVVPLHDEHYYALLEKVAGDWLEPVWLILLTVGPRRGEVLGISRRGFRIVKRGEVEVGTITMTGSLQRVRGKLKFLPAKSPKGNRTVELVPQVTEAIKRYLVRQKEERLKAGELWKDSGYLFTSMIGTPLEPRNVSRRWGKLLAAAKIPHTKLHASRHTVISILLREGADIQAVSAMAGHARASITLDVYGHVLSSPSVTAAKMGEVLSRNEKAR